MKISKNTLDKVLTIVAAASAPALTLCVDSGALSGQVATDIGTIVAAIIVAWHGGSAATSKLTTPSVQPPQ